MCGYSDVIRALITTSIVLVDGDELPTNPRLLSFSPSRLVFRKRSDRQIFQANLVSRLFHSAACLGHIHAVLEKLQQLQVFNGNDSGRGSPVPRDQDASSCDTDGIDDLGKILTSRGSAYLSGF